MIFLWPVALTLSFLNITEPHSTTKSTFIKQLTKTFLSLWMDFFFYCTVIQFFIPFKDSTFITKKKTIFHLFIEILRVLYSSFSTKYY